MLALGAGVGSGAGAGAPVVSMCPADAEIASVRLRMIAAHVFRKVFISLLLESCKNFASTNQTSMIGLVRPCKARTATLDLRGDSFLSLHQSTAGFT